MKIAVYSTQPHEVPYFQGADQGEHQFQLIKKSLDIHSIKELTDCDAVCCFVTDQLDRVILEQLQQKKVKLVALRSAGFDHVDLAAAKDFDITIVHVPKYSPHAVAEFTIGLMLAATRNIVRGHNRVQQHNFSLDGLCGFNLQGKTIGIFGTGHIGAAVAKLLSGFDCHLLAYDPSPNQACQALGVVYTTPETLWRQSDVISLHCPLNEKTRHLINRNTLSLMKHGIILINTARGGLIDTPAIIEALKNNAIGSLAIDVYEKERGLFFQDHTGEIIADDQFIQLQSFPNVLITGHQAFFSREAVTSIINTTIENIHCFAAKAIQNQVF
jgi:D-lactate dehydrogenase